MNLIGGFLGNDSMFGRLMTKIGTVIAANVLFVVCSIPFVTIGSAWKSLYHTIFTMINAEDAINPFRTFWQEFRKGFIRTTLYWLAFVGILVLGCIDLQACSQMGGGVQFFSAGVIAVMIIVVVTGLYLFPLLSVYTGKLTDMIKRSICFAVGSPLRLMVIVPLNVVPLMLYMIDEGNRPTYGFIGAFFWFGLIALITGKLLNSQMKKYQENIIFTEKKTSI